MRSDFWSLPYAARTAIQRGERKAHESEQRAWTIARLHERIKELEAENAVLRASMAALSTQGEES